MCFAVEEVDWPHACSQLDPLSKNRMVCASQHLLVHRAAGVRDEWDELDELDELAPDPEGGWQAARL